MLSILEPALTSSSLALLPAWRAIVDLPSIMSLSTTCPLFHVISMYVCFELSLLVIPDYKSTLSLGEGVVSPATSFWVATMYPWLSEKM